MGEAGRDRRRPWPYNMRRWVLGAPRNIHEPRLFQKLSLIAFLAWVGLGADGLSSAAYGPEQAFRKLGGHAELAFFLALATLLIVVIISFTYSRIIEHFPGGGGGYAVATQMLGEHAGLVSGCALLVDYVLTVSVSIAGAANAFFSVLPVDWQGFRLPVEALGIGFIALANLRGLLAPVALGVPIVLFFVLTHATLIGAAWITHAHTVPVIAAQLGPRLERDHAGVLELAVVILVALASGAGTFTGIEAVSNAVPVMRVPRVKTAKRAMAYVAVSLALAAGGILISYVMAGVQPLTGRTLNAVLAARVHLGPVFVVALVLSETAILRVAAQTGFIVGPRVMASMALDGWLPHRFSALSERLTMQNGVLLVGIGAIVTLILARGDIVTLLAIYSVNVFLTFTLSHAGMVRLTWQKRAHIRGWWRQLFMTGLGTIVCAAILIAAVVEKFGQGGAIALLITGALVWGGIVIRRQYRSVQAQVEAQLDGLTQLPQVIAESPQSAANLAPLDPRAPIAVLLVGGHPGIGLHTLFTILRLFGRHFRQVMFVSVAVVDSGNFKGASALEGLQQQSGNALQDYVNHARALGLAADSRMVVAPERVPAAVDLCRSLAKEYPRAVFFASKLMFRRERWHHTLLHNQTAYALQQRLVYCGLPIVVLPMRVL
jgi:amino acid transporter